MKIRGMPDAPETVWLRLTVTGTYYHTSLHDEPDAVRYVRADLYDALVERMRIAGAMSDPRDTDVE